jgi:hypothetical protein
MDSRLTRRVLPWLKSITQERAHRPARLRQPPSKASGGVFYEADFHGLTKHGIQFLAVAGFVDRQDWQCLLFHPRSFAETVPGGNSNCAILKVHRSVARNVPLSCRPPS